MDPRPTPGWLIARPSNDAGFASLEFVVAAALAMLFVVGLVQLVAYQYTKGAVTAGLERAARRAAVAGTDEADCLASLADSLGDVLGGVVAENLSTACTIDPDLVRTRASGSVPSWLPGPSLAFQVEVSAARELGP